ncbi:MULTISPECIES: 50S ribosomal protein L24 [Rothia]|jgi:ribosomal protein L24|uniref:Large ribosomal subunit protein uL24 n=3 Tax=Rothia aeria TaxID=172042 RepID=A0A2Z5R274_9MICC|nr:MULTISPECIES: 50S ribosomal protein L24 [Rothia]MBF1654340.1 50S ribosomal protein L24 [Rothia dentocariosa]OXT12641.1 50S ribosomal protein L24 [Rothia sp. Olga]EID50452.1 ribosomal protein L24 [Rothia aeria F0474]ERT65383.1 ribosomal protein L24 [Rothia aeria F0184]KGJ00328.1 50S ribosomal protein L24 [Rothia aeria]
MAKIKSGDLVQVISGADKGKQGKVLKVIPKENRVIVEGVKVVTKHTKANPVTGAAGGIQKVEAPIHVSNVAIVDPETKKPTRVGFREETVERNGKTRTVRVRYAKSSGKDI